MKKYIILIFAILSLLVVCFSAGCTSMEIESAELEILNLESDDGRYWDVVLLFTNLNDVPVEIDIDADLYSKHGNIVGSSAQHIKNLGSKQSQTVRFTIISSSILDEATVNVVYETSSI